ncbi:MAG: hypothetical protein Tsb002_01390 [Wenzhouxiangellaceae bacterium]
MIEGRSQGSALPPRPPWLDDEPEVLALLHRFIELLDRQPAEQRSRAVSIRLNRKLMPRLYRHDAAADQSWALLRSLDGVVVQIEHDHKLGHYESEYVKALLRLLPDGEAICRHWLQRPRLQAYSDTWTAAVNHYAGHFADSGAALSQRPIQWRDVNATSLVQAFVRIGDYRGSRLTLRQLSANCFWGHSKFLDQREALVQQLYPDLQITPRPVLAHVYLPHEFNAVLFIENQDSYLQCLQRPGRALQSLALVYVAGFRGGAERIRQPDGVSLHYASQTANASQATFEEWWFNNHNAPAELYFWGDLDYTGMAILKTLRQRFGNVQAWQPGYQPLVEALQAGQGHSAVLAGKEEQLDPGEIGCNYADSELLPLLRQCKRFIDQEQHLSVTVPLSG